MTEKNIPKIGNTTRRHLKELILQLKQKIVKGTPIEEEEIEQELEEDETNITLFSGRLSQDGHDPFNKPVVKAEKVKDLSPTSLGGNLRKKTKIVLSQEEENKLKSFRDMDGRE